MCRPHTASQQDLLDACLACIRVIPPWDSDRWSGAGGEMTELTEMTAEMTAEMTELTEMAAEMTNSETSERI